MEIRVTTAIGQTNSEVFHETSIHIHFRKNLQINCWILVQNYKNSEPNLDQLTSLKDRHGCSFSFMTQHQFHEGVTFVQAPFIPTPSHL